MKRHPSLYPLSHDHHHALVQARNLGIAAQSNNPDSLRDAAIIFIEFTHSQLQSHFKKEERFLLPLLARKTATDCPAIKETLDQHAQIRRLIEDLNDRLTKGESIDAHSLKTLGDYLSAHVRFEENILFPALEAAATADELQQLSDQLSSRLIG